MNEHEYARIDMNITITHDDSCSDKVGNTNKYIGNLT